MRLAQRMFAVALLFLKPNLRQPLYLALISILPISFVVIFWIVGGADLSHHALYGMLVVFSVNAGVVSLPQLTIQYRTLRLQEMYAASPVGPGVYAVGLGLSRFLLAAIPLSVVTSVLLGSGAMSPSALPWVSVVVLVSAFIGVMLGFLLSLVVTNVYFISTVANLSGMLLSVLPPVYYPLEMVPPEWRWAPLVVPTTHAAALLRISGGLSEAVVAPVIHWTVLLVYTAGIGLFVFWRLTWRET